MENKLYNQFAQLFPQFASGEYTYLDLKAQGFGSLSLEWIFGDRISIMHTFEMNGDLCYDPMMEFRFDNVGKTMTACAFQQSIPPLYQYFDDDGMGKSVDGNGNVTVNRHLLEELNDFASQWLINILKQQYLPVKGIMELNGEDIKITFDRKGQSILIDQETKEKAYDLGYGSLGNGITVWNRLEEKNGDYKTVAHIQQERSVKFYENHMPEEVKQQIIMAAHSFDDTALDPIKTFEKQNTNPLPDPLTTTAMRDEYGYTYENMLPLSTEKALELFDSKHCVYLLYPNETETMALEREEILEHNGFFGIEKEDWEHSPLYAAEKASAINLEGNLEADLLYSDADKFGIYQIRNDLENIRNYRFIPLKELKTLGLSIDRNNYELIYTAPFTNEMNNHKENIAILNQIYKDFNMRHPADFKGHSVSISDVIVLKTDEGISTYFVDSTGFTGLEAFLGDETKKYHLCKIDFPEKEQLTFSQVRKRSEITDEVISFARNIEPSPLIKSKPTLMERLEEGKRKALHESQKNNPDKDIRGVIE